MLYVGTEVGRESHQESPPPPPSTSAPTYTNFTTFAFHCIWANLSVNISTTETVQQQNFIFQHLVGKSIWNKILRIFWTNEKKNVFILIVTFFSSICCGWSGEGESPRTSPLPLQPQHILILLLSLFIAFELSWVLTSALLKQFNSKIFFSNTWLEKAFGIEF